MIALAIIAIGIPVIGLLACVVLSRERKRNLEWKADI